MQDGATQTSMLHALISLNQACLVLLLLSPFIVAYVQAASLQHW